MSNQQGAKITVYWLDKSRAQRVIFLLEELNLEYDVKVYKRGKDMLAPEELKEIHPLGKAPVVGIQAAGAEKPVILAESAVIVEYLYEHFGKAMIPKRYPDGKDGIVGAENEEYLRYRYLMHYAEGSLMSIMVSALIIMNIRKAPVPFFIRPITTMIANKVDSSFVDPNLKTHMTFLEDYLSSSPNNGEFFCGTSLTGADIMMLFPLEAAIIRAGVSETNYPKLYRYVRNLQGREAYKRAAERVSELSGEKYVPISDAKL
ncbi:glutathione transferase [Lophiotrema nucula]|uniref:glutathione transferase n=1 Tax=Lophiotrema nucula TaxID=690887 RepID=A0A6A5ZKJ5_9PLEO|nr:glutathione transferase [Lophiotrema nucula]